ncbi:MAG: hypothetical protein AAF757_09845 [Cyanobacteria bacterium P01_D01_bin.116]
MSNVQINSLVFRNVQNAPETFFNEEVYLLVYPDVKNDIEAGSISSGLEDYKQYGLEEKRVGFFLGSNGNDEITGIGEGTKIIAGVSLDTLLNGSPTTGVSEVDTLTGTEGQDIFLLGHPSLPGLTSISQQFYVGGGDADYALVKGFEKFDISNLNLFDLLTNPNNVSGLLKDSILLEKSLDNYKIEEVKGNMEISTADEDLVGIVEGVTSLMGFDIKVKDGVADVFDRKGMKWFSDVSLEDTFNIPFDDDFDGSFSVLV